MPCTENSMGLRFGLENPNAVPLRKYHWLFKIRAVSAEDSSSVKSLPPRRSSRPNLTWKEYEIQHLTETINYPFKPVWETIELVLYDICQSGKCNPVFQWIKSSQSGFGPAGTGAQGGLFGSSSTIKPIGSGGFYDPQAGTFNPVVDSGLKRQGTLEMYDGCGNVTETWTLDNCYPQHIKWGELDMDSSDIVTCEVTIRYDRAYCN